MPDSKGMGLLPTPFHVFETAGGGINERNEQIDQSAFSRRA
jgi:hypothetical protein